MCVKLTLVTYGGERAHVTADLWQWPCSLAPWTEKQRPIHFKIPTKSQWQKLQGYLMKLDFKQIESGILSRLEKECKVLEAWPLVGSVTT
jgi:hypothetical protein